MAIGSLWKLYKSSFNGLAALPGIQSRTLDPNTTLRLNAASGEFFPSFTAIQSQDPSVSFVTTDAEEILGTVGFRGLAINNAAGCELFYGKMDDNMNYLAGSVHTKKTARTGVVVVDSITLGVDADALINFTFHATKDAANDIWAITNTVALPANDLVTTKWKLAKIRIDTGGGLTELTGSQGCNITPNPNVIKYKASGEKHFTKNFVAGGGISIEITSVNIDEWNDLTLGGTKLIGWDIFLQKVDAADQEVAIASLAHIKMSGGLALAHLGPVGGDNNVAQDTSVLITPLRTGATVPDNDPIFVETSQAIPA